MRRNTPTTKAPKRAANRPVQRQLERASRLTPALGAAALVSVSVSFLVLTTLEWQRVERRAAYQPAKSLASDAVQASAVRTPRSSTSARTVRRAEPLPIQPSAGVSEPLRVNAGSRWIRESQRSAARAQFERWQVEHGYRASGRLDAVDDQQLQQLAEAGDPEAHQVLASRIVSAGGDLHAAQVHYLEASALGHTASIVQLVELSLARFRALEVDGAREHARRDLLTAAAWKEVASLRGDRLSHWAELEGAFDDRELLQIEAAAVALFDMLSKRREGLGMNAFQDAQPAIVSAWPGG